MSGMTIKSIQSLNRFPGFGGIVKGRWVAPIIVARPRTDFGDNPNCF
jgi:hypothetical protein